MPFTYIFHCFKFIFSTQDCVTSPFEKVKIVKLFLKKNKKPIKIVIVKKRISESVNMFY